MDRARPIGVSILSILVVATATLLAATDPKPGVDWPSYRGIGASGIAEGYPTVTSWNTETNTNVRWKTPVAGLSHSSPVVWGDQVCVTTAVNGEAKPLLKVGLYGDIKPVEDSSVHQWKVLCYDAATGKPRWEQTAHQGVPKVKRHTKATQANTTLATDGEHLVALFGAEGMYVYDMKGKLLWKKDLGRLDAGFFRAPEAQWGYASSPIIHAGRIIVQADVQKDSFLAAFDVKTGRELWRTPRADVPTFGTPAIYMSNGRAQIVVNGWKHIGGYDFETGKEVWKLVGGGDIPVPTPVVAHNLIFVTNAHGGKSPIYAVRPTATGDITPAGDATHNDHLAWSAAREGAYMQTPIVYGDHLYVCKDNGVLSVFNARTGEKAYQQRLGNGETGFSASAVAADGKLYYSSEDGDVYVLKAGATFEQLAKNGLGEVTMATPAISKGVIFFRTQGHLVAVGR
jgi:outer membrane protein assembly factor BamB